MSFRLAAEGMVAGRGWCFDGHTVAEMANPSNSEFGAAS